MTATTEARAARLILDGFEAHYAMMRKVGRAAQGLFEQGQWLALQQSVAARIDLFAARVDECVAHLAQEFSGGLLGVHHWAQVKLEYIALLVDHKQPELAETFFNSVSCRVLHRSYYNNQFIFVRPTISTEYLDLLEPSYRCYHPRLSGLRAALQAMVADFKLRRPFADLERDLRLFVRALRRAFPRPTRFEANCQFQVLESLFFRGNAAYIVGCAINGAQTVPFVVPILHDERGKLFLDALIVDGHLLNGLFSSTRAYFLVDVDVPATYVHFLRRLLPHRPTWELYAMLGLGKQSKALFYREYLHHLKHSRDQFVLAPGARGLVMSVFTLPSFPYVFKLIRDKAEPPKDVDRAVVKAQYQRVKRTDRVGRMADTLEYSDVVFPQSRFAPGVLEELQRAAPSLVQVQGEAVIVKHLYIERRLRPLDVYLKGATSAQVESAMRDYGACVKELAAANIFAGDLLFKNFGVTRLGRVVFYDYDEIDEVTQCHFRHLPQPSFDEDELRGEPWFSVNPRDVFPEEWPKFLCAEPRYQQALMKHHPDLFDPEWWKTLQARLRAGQLIHISTYPSEVRFRKDRNSSAWSLASGSTLN